MRFKVGDKVKVISRDADDKFHIGKELLKNNEIVGIDKDFYVVKAKFGWEDKQYGNDKYWSVFDEDLKPIKPKASHITLAQASKSAEKEKAEQKCIDKMIEIFCSNLSKI